MILLELKKNSVNTKMLQPKWKRQELLLNKPLQTNIVKSEILLKVLNEEIEKYEKKGEKLEAMGVKKKASNGEALYTILNKLAGNCLSMKKK